MVIDVNNISRHIFSLAAQIYQSYKKQKTPLLGGQGILIHFNY